MAGFKQQKRVSWASGVKLCQVRLFLSEDAPFQSGLGTQDNLQAKASWMLHTSGTGSDDSLPPGFEAPHLAHQFRVDVSKITIVKWKSPCKIVLNPEWRVVAGDESEEVAVQNQRELRILEVFYPHETSIPPNPFVLPEVQDSSYDDSKTPLIPITAIEDEDASDKIETPLSLSDCMQARHPDSPLILPSVSSGNDRPVLSHTAKHLLNTAAEPAPILSRAETMAGGPLSVAQPDVVAAASAAFTAIMRSNEEGSMIDRDLLISILNNPSLVDKLVSEYGAPQRTQPPSVPASAPQPLAPPPSARPPLPQINNSTLQHFPVVRPSQLHSVPNTVPPVPINPQPSPAIQIPVRSPASGPPVKDVNYYKSLIQQHGGDQQSLESNSPHIGNFQNVCAGVNELSSGIKQQRQVKPKIPKPCAYFNTPRGCRNGASCIYQHDASAAQRIEYPQGSKRIKMERGIPGRN